MHPSRSISFYATVSILFSLVSGCATGGRGIAVTACVIPPPHMDKGGKLVVDGAECTDAAGNEEGVPRPFILMPRWVCHDSEDYFKILEALRK